MGATIFTRQMAGFHHVTFYNSRRVPVVIRFPLALAYMYNQHAFIMLPFTTVEEFPLLSDFHWRWHTGTINMGSFCYLLQQ